MVVNTLGLALVLIGVSMGPGQEEGKAVKEKAPPPKKEDKDKAGPGKSKLEEMLAEALKNNPDIRVAAAKVAEADAELIRTRLQVTQKIVTLYHALDAQKKMVESLEAKLRRQRMANQSAPGSISNEELEAVEQLLTAAKAKLAELEAQMPALLGKAPSTADPDVRDAAVRALGLLGQNQRKDAGVHRGLAALAEARLVVAAEGQQADKIRKALETPITVHFKGAKLPDALKELEKKVPDLSFHDHYTDRYKVGLPPITLSLDKPLPVAAVLQAVEDIFLFPGSETKNLSLCFVIRQYGVVAVARGELPPGAVTVEEFLRHKPAQTPRDQGSKPRPPKNPPGDQVEGLIKQVDSSGLVTISIGSDAGLAKGHTLEVFRLSDKPSESKYLGTIRILDVTAKQAVGQPVGRLFATPRSGDRVASRLPGN
jgi:hypothetical protein